MADLANIIYTSTHFLLIHTRLFLKIAANSLLNKRVKIKILLIFQVC